jgi:hypothetical protein
VFCVKYNGHYKSFFFQHNLKSINNILQKRLIKINLLIDNLLRKEFFKGGHFVVKDSGELYDQMSTYGYERISSHYNSVPKPASDIGIKSGKTIAQLLIGKTNDFSWFQIENSAMPKLSDIFNNAEDFNDFIGHTRDTLLYISSLKTLNVGQYGSSWHPDCNPIILENAEYNVLEDQSVTLLGDNNL